MSKKIKEPNLIIEFESANPTREEIIRDIAALFDEISTWDFEEKKDENK